MTVVAPRRRTRVVGELVGPAGGGKSTLSRDLVRLATLHRKLASTALDERRPVLFDEGPIFALAWLRGFGHEIMRSPATEAWWQATLREWASVMDLVVVVEANDVLLARRIRTRPHPHEVKGFADPEI